MQQAENNKNDKNKLYSQTISKPARTIAHPSRSLKSNTPAARQQPGQSRYPQNTPQRTRKVR